MNEVWKDIKGYEGLYQISNKGRVKSIARIEMRNNGSFFPVKEKICGGNIDTKGYIQVDLRKNKKRKMKTVHRLVAEAFIPNPHNKPQVNHINGIKTDNCINNLEWVTNGENQKHAFKMGLNVARYGAEHPRSVLTKEDEEYIRKNYKPRSKEFGVIALSRRFNCSVAPIYRVIKGK